MDNKWLLIQEYGNGGFLVTFPPNENQESVPHPTLESMILSLKGYFGYEQSAATIEDIPFADDIVEAI